jgi:hypothetical protein
MNIDNLSNKELATCVDEFVKRAIQHAKDVGITDKSILVSITASTHGENEYKIEHRASISDWPNEWKSVNNNLVAAMDNACARWLADQLDAPTVVRPMIEHKPEQPVDEAWGNEEIVGDAKGEAEDAQFEEHRDD